MLSQDDIETLYKYEPGNHLVSSLYLPISPDQSPNQLETSFKSLTGEVRKNEFPGKTKTIRSSLKEDQEKFRDFLESEDIREDFTRSIALFSCSEDDFWETYKLPVSLDRHFSIGQYPYLRPLSMILNQSHRTLVISVDRHEAVFYDIFMNMVLSRTKIESEVPKNVRKGGFRGYEEKRISRNIEDHVDKHMKKAARHGLETFREEDHDFLILAGQKENRKRFQKFLHSYLEENLIGTFDVNPDEADREKILEKSEPIIEEAEREKEQRTVEGLKNEVKREGLGVTGLESTIEHLNEGKLRKLIINRDFEAEGSQCPFCDTLSTEEPGPCEYCNKLTQPVSDLVDRIIGATLRNGGSTEHIQSDQSFISDAGIGGLLHYK